MTEDPPVVKVGRHLLSVPSAPAASWLASEFSGPSIYELEIPGDVESVLDCGANVGAATSFFLQRYPQCTVVAVEADPLSFEYLLSNIRSNGCSSRVTAVEAAVLDRNGTVGFSASREGSEGYSLRMSTDESRMGVCGRRIDVRCTDIAELVGPGKDLVKMDIEGAEYCAVARLAETRRLQLVKYFFVEVHHYPRRRSRLAELFRAFEAAEFRVELVSVSDVGASPDGSQDILLLAVNACVDAC